MSRLASRWPVAWLEPSRHWREAPIAFHGHQAPVPAPEHPGLFIHPAEPWLPWTDGARRLRGALLAVRATRAAAHLRKLGCRKIVLYLWRPEFSGALGASHAFSVFHIDDDYAFQPTLPPPDPHEVRLIHRVGLVVVASPGLMDRKGRLNPNTLFLPNGVDFANYAKVRPCPNDLAVIARPRLGYAGFLKPQLDWGLLLAVAQYRPDWSLVLVGGANPVLENDPSFQALRRQANVAFLGHRPTVDLPAYVQHFDVCLMPYQRTEYTDCIYPLKLHEYLAAGRPVVATPIRSLLEFSAVVRLANGPMEWVEACERALAAPADHAARSGAVATAREHDWSRLTETLALRIESGVVPGMTDAS